MIDIRKLKELVRLMVNNDLTELDLRDSEEQVTLRRQGKHVEMPAQYAQPMQPVAARPTTQQQAPAAPSDGQTQPPQQAGAAGEPAEEDGLIAIESPMVGTFYSSPNPDAPPFVNVGDEVDPDTVVCLLEAMKIFNEIKAEQSGTIRKVCVESGASVEFGQPLFLIKRD